MIPSRHRSKWKKEELDFIKESIANKIPLEEITEVICLRSSGAILTKANNLGFGYYTNEANGLTYLRDEIKHKERKCKDESITTPKEVDITGKEDSSIVSKKAVDNAFYAGSVEFMLQRMKDNKCLYL